VSAKLAESAFLASLAGAIGEGKLSLPLGAILCSPESSLSASSTGVSVIGRTIGTLENSS